MGTPARPTGIGFVWFFLLNAGKSAGGPRSEAGAWEVVM